MRATARAASARRQAVLLSGDDLGWHLELAAAWAAAGDSVTVVLLDAAAAAARPRHQAAAGLDAALASGVVILAEVQALRRRGLMPDGLAEGVKSISLDEVADLLIDGTDRAVWL